MRLNYSILYNKVNDLVGEISQTTDREYVMLQTLFYSDLRLLRIKR